MNPPALALEEELEELELEELDELELDELELDELDELLCCWLRSPPVAALAALLPPGLRPPKARGRVLPFSAVPSMVRSLAVDL